MADQKLADYAPTITEAGVTKVYCDSIELKEPVEAKPLPTLTKKIVEAVIAEFVDIEAANGYLSIAQRNGVTMSQVKTLHSEFMQTKNPPEVVVVKEEPIEITK